MIFENKDKIVFTGDSVTDAGRKRPVGEGLWEGLGTGYVRNVDSMLAMLYPEMMLHIANTGTGGAASCDMLARWQTDVMDLKPDWVFLMIGANDVWRQFDEPNLDNDRYMPERYRENLEAMVSQTMPTVKGMFLISPFYMESNDNDAMKKRMVEYANISREVAEKYGARYIDVQEEFDKHLQYRYPAYISLDRVHPGWVGAMIIASKILKEIGAKTVYMTDMIHTTKTYETLLQTIVELEIDTKFPTLNEEIMLGNARLAVLGPVEKTQDVNDMSIVLRLDYGEISFMFTGDAGKESEKLMLKEHSSSAFKAQVLKLGHHGSSSSNTKEFLLAVDPTYAVISCGKDNSYGHPHKEVVDLLDELNIRSYITYEHSNIVFSTNGEKLELIRPAA
jgi:lysophospholipase L1-like esterase